jgi:ferredoxin--NADP+ reductase
VDRLPEWSDEQDVLVVGSDDHAVELTATLASRGASVVLAAGGMRVNNLPAAAAETLQRLEKERRATILYRSVPEEITEEPGLLPMAFFDRRTPDLEFDYVVFASGCRVVDGEEIGLTGAAATSGKAWFWGEAVAGTTTYATVTGPNVRSLLADSFPELEIPPEPSLAERRRADRAGIEELRERHYNATITVFEPTHSDLWVLRVRPDHGETSHLPGQYASLGLGHWEERIDDAVDPDLDEKWEKLVRRSYSISSRMFDDYGYLAGHADSDELEFYIVLVPPTPDNVPGLTPRLALKRPGDRIYLGPKVAGRYTLAPVTDPKGTVLFFSTGTGEAPHNAMVVELLRKGHRGPIVSAVSVRQWADLGYIDKHRQLESMYPNYHYLPMPTREPDVPKRYIQDLIVNDTLNEMYGIELDSKKTHVFLCGNPAMIGIPKEEDGAVIYPETTGVIELLSQRGFTMDHRKERGNIHVEEYW